jgi:hypothetical protein
MANPGLKRPRRGRFASPLRLSFEPILLRGPPFWPSQIMTVTHDPLVSAIIIPNPFFLFIAPPLRLPQSVQTCLFDFQGM